MNEIEILGEEPKDNIYILRTSLFKLILRIVKIEFYLTIAFIITRFGVTSFENLVDEYISFDIFYLLITTFFGILSFYIMLNILLNWVARYFIIKNGEFIERKGIMNSKQLIKPLVGVEWIQVRQGFLGKLMNFGDLIIHTPLLKKNLIVKDISSPEKFQQHIYRHFKTSSSQVLRSAETRR